MKRLACIAMLLAAANVAGARELRVCADPNNLPFSNAQREGFENAIVEVIARDLGADVEYIWWAQRRGALRNTLNAGKCDVVPGIASSMEMLATTRPYYRGTYMFVARRDSPWRAVATFDDPQLRDATIGVQLVGDDGANTPPAHSLARRGMVANVRGFTVYGDYARPDPQAAIVDAVADGRVDIAVVWGPTAGYYAARHGDALQLVPVQPWLDGPLWPMTFDISLGVRRDDRELRRELDRALERNAAEIAAILARFHVGSVAPP
ncbi:quinoprotein dehydrogenase-associated putative ABC transporter substrate-binding protein [Lysobacter auxotrophicus]|uniref:Quinoprotein dehydrogenase-associated putative ABC transporter substrate-binding protein n=1 Tax=Lysobacter auxotrophicus TaxID=2992573 RepID=A0ABN6UJE2_9GAMM|nr:quinoprotein dehydrogenase-associated putative ABC transporter substrate-binding protein [Lysobacter auxotrophicus]BDU16419.1 quinoprotein dehydrogenase-associated putative ABC transporter substrate-binding protein [Lysobacter auxotrophicus]